jgi:hypothetical protein
MGRKIGLAEAEAEFGCHLAELCQRGDLYGAEGHWLLLRCQQVVARSILINHRRLASHVSAQGTGSALSQSISTRPASCTAEKK